MEQEIIRIIENASERLVIAIDGKCASGKTTLAEKIKGKTRCVVVHMDDFFMPKEKRTDLIGGNIDFERLINDVLLPFKKGEKIIYKPFLCKVQALGEERVIEKENVILLEGTYSTHEKLKCYIDHSFFMDIEKEEQLERIKKRNPQNFEDFVNIWLVREEEYFKAKKHSQ